MLPRPPSVPTSYTSHCVQFLFLQTPGAQVAFSLLQEKRAGKPSSRSLENLTDGHEDNG